jgi:hypothetical protein
MEQIGKLLVGLGGVLIVVGFGIWLGAGKLGWCGHLPGDIVVERPGFRLYAPIMTMLLLSVGVSCVLWLIGKLLR